VPVAEELRTRSGRRLAQDRALLVAAPAICLFLAWDAYEGGYSQVYWYPGALLLVALAALVVGGAALDRLSGTARVALAFLAAFTVWCYCSIAWAGVKGDAWDGANRTLLYLAVYALFVLLPWSGRSATVVVGAYALGVAAIGTGTLVRVAAAADPTPFFLEGRLASPTSYPNGNCAVFTFAFLLLAYLASRRETPLLLRPLMTAGCVVLVVLDLLAQSRGWLVAMVATAILYLFVVPARTRSAGILAIVGAAVAAVVPRALDVYPAAKLGVQGPELAATACATAVAVAAAALAVLVWAVADRRYAPRERWMRRVDRALGVTLASAIVLTAVLLGSFGHPVRWASHGWRQFTHVSSGSHASRFSLGSGVSGNRYDLWRVALREFERRPLVGVGVDNFAADYVRERRSPLEEPLYPHSLELRALAQTGVVGAALFAVFLGSAFAAAVRLRPRAAADRGLRLAIAVGAAYWVIHGSADWFWEIPGASAPVLAGLAIAAAPARLDDAATDEPRRHRRRLRGTAVALAGAAAAASLAFPLLAALYVRNATHTWRGDSSAAYAALDRARRLDPLSAQPDLVAGAIASRLGDHRRMRRSFANAVRRNPSSWYGFLELGIADALTGHRAAALAHLATARRLDPLEPVIPAVLAEVRARRRIDARRIDAIFLRRASSSTPPRDRKG
jgi:tetratricopeptide (TPR) repeat protein